MFRDLPPEEECFIDPDAFAKAMAGHWGSLGNASSPRLIQLWKAMAMTFAEAIQDHSTVSPKWRVLQPPTGTGKTQGLCVYAAMTIKQNVARSGHQLGILIVTRTIAQADEIASTIRTLAGEPEATEKVVTKHSENQVKVADMRAADALVITHAAYTRTLEGLNKGVTGRWEDLTEWLHGRRRLTVIDEALAGIVEENQVRAEHVRQLLGYIGPELQRRFEKPVEALNAILAILDEIGNVKGQCNDDDHQADRPLAQARIVWRAIHEGRLVFPEVIEMGSLREAMAALPYDNIALRKSSSFDRQRIAKHVDDSLKNCEAIIARWAY